MPGCRKGANKALAAVVFVSNRLLAETKTLSAALGMHVYRALASIGITCLGW